MDIGACEYADPTSCTPRAFFTATQTAGIDPLTAYFDASFSGGSQYDGAGFIWDFGDGSTGSDMTTSHTYNDCGFYDVRLTVTTECGSHSLTLGDLIKVKSSKVTKEVGAGHSYTSIQAAINDAVYGEIILVHDGTYIENINFKGKEILVRSENGPAATLIDGNARGSVVTFDHVEVLGSILEGFTILNGYAPYGSGIFSASSSPQIINCIIRDNKASENQGGGIACIGSSAPQVTQCTIIGKMGVWDCGIYCTDTSSPQIANCTIKGNMRSGIVCTNTCSPQISHCTIKANMGSGISCNGSCSPLIIDCIISGNEDGGGIYCGGSSFPQIRYCTISGNTEFYDIYEGGGITCADSSSPVIEDCIIRNNNAILPGGIACTGTTSPRIIHCTINENTASFCGGIFCGGSSSPQISNCIIRDNSSSEFGGGIFCGYDSSTAIVNCIISGNKTLSGGGIFCDISSLRITNCTISDNLASVHGGGMYCRGGSSPEITNSILWGDMADGDSNEIFLEMDSSVTVTYSDIQQDANVYPGIGNINLDPLFTGIEPGKYYLQADSPCIDAGTPEDAPAGDQAGIARPQGPGIDMGAYEYVDPLSCTPRALFTATHTTGTDSLTVYLDASASGGSLYSGAGFAWEFGDGGTGSGMIVSHTYSGHGSYDVSLTVTTECGAHSLTWYDPVRINSSQVTKEVGEGYEYASIQEAIDDAAYGDIILVHDGTYIENINFKGKGITVLSENGPAHTVITKKGGENTVEFNHAEGAYSVLKGFTIKEYPYQSGNGISCSYSSPQIINCTIRNVKRIGIDCSFSSPRIIYCTITGSNRSGIYSSFSSPQITNCTISENGRSGIFSLNSTLTITDCIITGNTTPDLGGGIYCEDSKPTIVNSLLQDNQAGGVANAVYLMEKSVPVVSDYSDMQLVNYGKDDRILIQKCNKNTGRWQSGYRFFRKPCGTALPLEMGDILFISLIP